MTLGEHAVIAPEAARLVDTESAPHVTAVRAAEPDFFRVAGAWRMMIESRATLTVHEACVVARRAR